MIQKALHLFRSKKDAPKVYSEVVSSEDTSAVADLLRVAAKRANQDQRSLVEG